MTFRNWIRTTPCNLVLPHVCCTHPLPAGFSCCPQSHSSPQVDSRPSGVEPRVLCYLSHCSDGISAEKSFRKLGSILAYSLRVQSAMTGKAWHGSSRPSYGVHSQEAQREECWLSWLSFCSVQDHSMWDGAHSQDSSSHFTGKIPFHPQGSGRWLSRSKHLICKHYFDPWNLQKESIPLNCPLTPTYVLWLLQPSTHTCTSYTVIMLN